MVVLRKSNKCYTKESKQVGNLYHVTTLEGVANYIAPNDTLSGSGKYMNYLLGGKTDVVSFTRNKSFVVSTRTTRQANVLFDFEVDGDRLSENHRIIPYNDLAYSKYTGKVGNFPTNPKALEYEEVVEGKIHPFSKYVKSIRFCFSFSNIEDMEDINDDLQKCKSYLSKFPISCDPKLKHKISSDFYVVPFPSFDAFIHTVESITKILNNDSLDEGEIKDAFQYFSKEQLEEESKSLLYLANSNVHTLDVLDIAIEQKGGDSLSAKKAKLTYDKIEKFIDKNKLRDLYVETRLDSLSANSYMKYSLKDKEELLWKYSDFDSEQKYTIANMAKSWFKDHPEDVDCGPYGKLSNKDFEGEINIYKILYYLYLNYDRRKVDSLLFDLIRMDGRNIANQEFNFLEDPDEYTIGFSKLKGNDLFEYLTTWTDLFSEKELLLKLKDL